jgi:hypothetical protein
MMEIVGVLLLAVFVIALVSFVIYEIYFRSTLHRPVSWEHRGVPPEHIDIALDVIRELLPSRPGRWGGVIEWVDTIFELPYGQGMAAGLVVDSRTPEIRVTRFPDVWDTALAHELVHVFAGYADGDARLVPLFSKMNEEIERRARNA